MHNNTSFPRKVLWLKVAPTNRDPAVILGYYLECVAILGGKVHVYCCNDFTLNSGINHVHDFYYIGCPRIICIDKGTEDVLITESQTAFRLRHDDSLAAEKSVRVGLSPANSVNMCMV